MKSIVFIFSILTASQSFASLSLDCKNRDGEFRLVPAAPCAHCAANSPAFDFIGGDGLLASGIPAYESDMPGYIDYDRANSARTHRDVLSLIDGGTWTITVTLPERFLTSNHPSGEVVQAGVDSIYDDISEDELDDIAVTCTVE